MSPEGTGIDVTTTPVEPVYGPQPAPVPAEGPVPPQDGLSQAAGGQPAPVDADPKLADHEDAEDEGTPTLQRNEAYTIGRDALVNKAKPIKEAKKTGTEPKTPQEKSLDYYATLHDRAQGQDGTFSDTKGQKNPIITGGADVIGESLYIVQIDGKWQAAAKDTPNAVILQQLNGKTTTPDGNAAFVGMTADGTVINDLDPQTVLDADLISEGENLISQCSEPTQRLLRARMEAIKQGKGEDPQAVDRNLVKEAAAAEHKILNESLLSGAQKALPEKQASANATPEETAEIQRFNDRRTALLDRLQQNIVTTPEDMSEFLSLYSPDSLNRSIAQSQNELNIRLAQLQGLQNTEQARPLNDQINTLRKEISNMERAKKFFEDPSRIKGFFDIMPSLTAEQSAKINADLAEGKIDDSLEKMVEAKIASLPPDQQAEARKRMEQLKGVAMVGGGIALLIIMMLTQSVGKH